ncbi:CHAD domain-containing protein [Herbaspirillum lusitanum]|uniref:CHAD domain-containing protein n=1 Tax=Herbaspirillum lusitanum TaxID=213312 RepID=A0ABW9ACV9_9BURK
METELKLLIAPEHAAALLQHPLLARYAIAAPRAKQQLSVYFDTPAFDISRRRAGLRVRQIGERFVQTLKAGGGVSGGLHQRNEWESPVDAMQPDMDALQALMQDDLKHGMPALKAIFAPAVADHIAPIFSTRIERTLWDLELADANRQQISEIEFVLDRGAVEHRDLQDPISEIELELKSGNPCALFDLALQLLDDIPLQIGNRSKAERGYALLAAPAPKQRKVVKARPLSLSGKMNVEQAFLAVIGNCLDQIQGNDISAGAHELANIEGGAVETLHQLRVGLRRLRSAFTLFQRVIALPDDLHQGFGRLAQQIGAARDWDVLSHTTLPQIAATADATDISALTAAAAARAGQMHEAAAAAMRSSDYTRLMLRFGRWLAGSEWRSGMPPHALRNLTRPLSRFAGQQLEHDRKRMQKRGKAMLQAEQAATNDGDNSAASARHRTRIAAKKLRYDTEFFSALYAGSKSRPYLKTLSTLQQELGTLNDLAVAGELLAELTESAEHARLASEVAFVRGYITGMARSDGQARRAAQRHWTQWKTRARPWRK